jgi:hypothetical protein
VIQNWFLTRTLELKKDREKEQQEDGNAYIIVSLMICILHQTLCDEIKKWDE